MGRDSSKVDKALFQRLESFVQCTSIYDILALDEAVNGVDAIICANTYVPEVVVEGQLLLLRAAERTGVKIFHAASWNYDWTNSPLGEHEGYDPYIASANHVRISSSIKPLFMMAGIIVECFFDNPRGSSWDRKSKTLSYFGDGSEALVFSTADDLAAYTVEAISAPDAGQGGIIRVENFRLTPEQMVRDYEAARSGEEKAQTKCVGSLADAEKMLAKARKVISVTEFEKYIGLGYVVHMLKGTWDYEAGDVQRFGGVKQTSLKQWFERHPDV